MLKHLQTQCSYEVHNDNEVMELLKDESSDLYNNICKEYLIQLNAEIKSIYSELEEYELIERE